MRKAAMGIACIAAAVPLLGAISGCDSCGARSSGSGGGDKPRFVNVVKLTGIGWFDRMQTGVVEFGKESGVDATQVGPAEASAEQQVKMIQDVIAQRPKAITVVPNSPEALEGVLKQAMDAGIVVVTHEAASQKNTSVDIEAFDNAAYGAKIMDGLAQCMGGSGKYAVFVGAVTAKTHMEWAEGALQEAKSKYPGIIRVADPIESKEKADIAYERTKELLQKYTDLKGIQGGASVDVAGIGRAVQELGLQGKTCVMGTSIPSVAGQYLKDGSVDKIFFWDPAVAGKAMMTVAKLLVDGKTVTPGLDLHLPGYESLQPDPAHPKSFHGSAWIEVDQSNADKYPF